MPSGRWIVTARVFLLLAVGLALSIAAPLAQDDSVESRLEKIAGISPDGANLFFEALRRNVGTGDRRASCSMVAYPLRHPEGEVADAAACEARYDAIFTVPVRRAVGRQQFRELFVNQSGAAVGAGELWFAGRCRQPPCTEADIRITAIDVAPGLRPPGGKVLIACLASGRAVRVTADGSGGAGFRMWPTSDTSGAPDVDLARGAPTPEATGLCAWRAWTFAGPETYTVAEVGCMANPVPAPMGTVARVTRARGGTLDGIWCFE